MDVTAALFTAAVTVGTLAPSSAVTVTPATTPIAAAVRTVETPAAGQVPNLRQISLTSPSSSLSSSRPAPLVPLYASLAVLQGLDIYTTSKAMSRGAVEANPLMQPVAGRAWGSTAVKAAATAGSIYFIERAWKNNRKGAVILAAVINVATAAVVAHNTQTAR
jgi:hypothetical protein